MPRNSTGVFSLPVAAYVSGTTIKSADMNTNLNDIATALTQSLATTGVTVMTSPLPLASGTVGAPGLTWASATKTGFYLAGANQMGWTANGVLGATFNADTSVTWAGAHTFSTTLAVTGAATFNGAVALNGATTFAAALIKGGGGSFDSSTVFIASGATHAIGTVPDPGAVAGTSRFLREDATWAGPAASKGECQLTLSGANLLLSPYNGNILFINSAGQVIPDAGVTLGIGAAIAATFYYIYAFMSGATMTLEFSTTAPAAQAGTGIKIKTGDATRTLVGAAYTDTAAAWRDQSNKRWLLSWFNRRRKSSNNTFSADRTTGSLTYVELNSEIRSQFINWNEEEVLFSASGTTSSGNASGNATAVGFDGITAEPQQSSGRYAAANGVPFPFSLSGSKSGLTEAAVHYMTLLGTVGGGTGTWYSSTSGLPIAQSSINISING